MTVALWVAGKQLDHAAVIYQSLNDNANLNNNANLNDIANLNNSVNLNDNANLNDYANLNANQGTRDDMQTKSWLGK